MKNIHVLPTDKPSRLVKFFTKRFHLCKEILPIQDEEQYQNIYITSDEQIKDVRPHKGKWQLEKGLILNKFPTYLTDLSECKLIILTTDKDLIKDGVQAIDDEFLEWFVKNPSCESVDVESNYRVKSGTIQEHNEGKAGYEYYEYKIIIPKEEFKYPIGGYAPGYYSCRCVTCKSTFQGDKRAVQCEPCAIKMTNEEPKPIWEQIIEDCGGEKEFMKSAGLLPKQETLEETLKNELEFVHKSCRNHDFDLGFKTGGLIGAKQQQERMYGVIDEYVNDVMGGCNLRFDEWIFKFKKKQSGE